MSLLDHFHPPLSQERHWESFHAVWATEIVGMLNQSVLPPSYFAEAQVHVGSRIEVDAATFERDGVRSAEANRNSGGVVVDTWAPPATAMVMPTVFPDEVEVQVLGGPTGAHLVAAIELISPGNKDRPETRRAFAAKCASYLQLGIGLVVVDVVTERPGNLHDDLVTLLQQDERFRFPTDAALYTVAYRPARREPGGDQIDIWPVPLALGQSLPIMPLALRGAATLPLDLKTTYMEARQRSRL
jgi:hypothetical protein